MKLINICKSILKKCLLDYRPNNKFSKSILLYYFRVKNEPLVFNPAYYNLFNILGHWSCFSKKATDELPKLEVLKHPLKTIKTLVNSPKWIISLLFSLMS